MPVGIQAPDYRVIGEKISSKTVENFFCGR